MRQAQEPDIGPLRQCLAEHQIGLPQKIGVNGRNHSPTIGAAVGAFKLNFLMSDQQAQQFGSGIALSTYNSYFNHIFSRFEPV